MVPGPSPTPTRLLDGHHSRRPPSEGTIFVRVAVGTETPQELCAAVDDAVSFHLIDRSEGTGARGNPTGDLPVYGAMQVKPVCAGQT